MSGLEAAAGNIFGGVLNYAMNSKLQEKQFKEQEKLQERAFEMNEQAVQNQAANMAHGLENAGLNPAAATGGLSAPTIAAGTAAGSSSQLQQVFSGLSELVSAIKAPTEIEKTAAETGLIGKQTEKTGAETSKIQAELPEITANIEYLNAKTKEANNINEAYQAEKEFLAETSAAIFDSYIGQLKATKQWENLPPKTKETLDALANGDLDLDVGRLQALDKIIRTQGEISNRDAQILANTKQMVIDYKQMTDEKIMNAIAALPKVTQRKMLAEIKKTKHEIQNLLQTNKNLKTQDLLMTSQGVKTRTEAKKINTERELMELNDLNYLLSKGRYRDASRLHALNAGRELWDMTKGIVTGGAKAATTATVLKALH